VLEEEVMISVGQRQRGKKLSEQMWPTPTTRDWKDTINTVPPSIGKTRGHSLGQKVAAEMKLWPTPRSSNLMNQQMTPELANRNKGNLEEVVAEKMWPTPRASDVEGGVAKDVQSANGRFFRQNEKGEKWGVKLRDTVNHVEQVGQLNSEWVTWLMGYPQGYLDISTENQNISQELPKEKKTEPKS